MPVFAGTTIEITIAQMWNSAGCGMLHMELSFHGLALFPGHLIPLDGSAAVAKLLVRCAIAEALALRSDVFPSFAAIPGRCSV